MREKLEKELSKQVCECGCKDIGIDNWGMFADERDWFYYCKKCNDTFYLEDKNEEKVYRTIGDQILQAMEDNFKRGLGDVFTINLLDNTFIEYDLGDTYELSKDTLYLNSLKYGKFSFKYADIKSIV